MDMELTDSVPPDAPDQHTNSGMGQPNKLP